MPVQDWDAKFREAPAVPRPELPILAGIPDADARLFLRFYLRSNIQSDQDIAKARCEKFGIDYAAARDAARNQP
jgi:hypothetical protein